MFKEDNFTQGTRLLLLEGSMCRTKIFRRILLGWIVLDKVVDLSFHFQGSADLHRRDHAFAPALTSTSYFLFPASDQLHMPS